MSCLLISWFVGRMAAILVLRIITNQ